MAKKSKPEVVKLYLIPELVPHVRAFLNKMKNGGDPTVDEQKIAGILLDALTEGFLRYMRGEEQ